MIPNTDIETNTGIAISTIPEIGISKSSDTIFSSYSGITINTNAETGIGMISDTSIGKHTGVISTIPEISINTNSSTHS